MTKKETPQVKWTEQEVKILQAMYNDGETMLAISKALGRTISACTNKMDKLIPVRKLIPYVGKEGRK